MSARVELIYDADCPNVGAARAQLLRAFGVAGLQPRWTEWRRDHGRAPGRVQRYGSPTILVNQRDVAPSTGAGDCCRVYLQADGSMAGVPPVNAIASALAPPGRRFNWRDAGVALPALGIALLPKLICPACWPAYAALVAALGMPFLLETRFLLPLTLAALTVVVGLLAWRAHDRRGYGPAGMAVLASVSIFVAKFLFSSMPAVYVSAGLLLTACIWNSWPARRAPPSARCPACPPQDSSLPSEGGSP